MDKKIPQTDPKSTNTKDSNSMESSSTPSSSFNEKKNAKESPDSKKDATSSSSKDSITTSSDSDFEESEIIEKIKKEKKDVSKKTEDFKLTFGQNVADAFNSTLSLEVTKDAQGFVVLEEGEEEKEKPEEKMIILEEVSSNASKSSSPFPAPTASSLSNSKNLPENSDISQAPLDDMGKERASSKKSKKMSSNARFGQILKVLTKYHALQSMTPQKLRMILEDLGPTYVKFGQIMSSRQDLLPPAYTHELEKLRSKVNPMPYEMVREEIIKAYGQAPEDIFASFSKTPLGSASMAQVHEATTKDGQKVVVKVQRPGLYEQMKVDVDMMQKGAKLLSKNKTISSLVDLPELIDEFWTTSKEEMDFRHEAANANRFGKQMEGLNYIKVPKIFNEFTRPNILVMEDIGGIQIDDYPHLDQEGYSREEIAMRLGLNFLDQIIEDGFFHADPHSGNLKVDNGRIAWIDFGMMGEITKSEANSIGAILKALAARDVAGLADGVLEIGIPPANLDYIGFCNALENYLNRYLSQSFDDLDLGVMAEEAIEICHEYKIKLPKGIAMLGRSLVTIQGTLKDLNPQVNMLSYISKEKTSFDQIDWNQEIESSLRQMYADYKALLNLPLRADRILGLLQKGQLRVGISVSDLEQTILPSLNQTIDRVVVVILIAALLVGSSIVCTTNMKPTFLDIPLLGFAGFFVSFCLSLWLFYKMLFRPKKGDQLF